MSNGMTRREKQVTDLAEIRGILERSMVVHIGLIDGDEPSASLGIELAGNGEGMTAATGRAIDVEAVWLDIQTIDALV